MTMVPMDLEDADSSGSSNTNSSNFDCKTLPTLLSNLFESGDKSSAILDLKIYLNTFSIKSSPQLASCLPSKAEFLLLFELLTCVNRDTNTKSNREFTQNVSNVLSQLLSLLKPDDLFHNFHDEIISGFKHPNIEVKLMCCLQVKRVVEDEDWRRLVLNEPELVHSLIDCLCISDDSSGMIVKEASHALSVIAMCEAGACMLFEETSSVLIHMKECLSKHNSTICFRIFEVVVKCCVHSTEAMKFCQSNTLLGSLLDKFGDSDDILSRVVAITTLTPLTSCKHGYQWLKLEGVFTKLEAALSDDDPFSAIVMPEILKFFAALSKHFADLLESHHGRFLNTLCRIIGSDETSFDLLEAAIDCLTVVLSYDGGKFALNSLGDKFKAVIRRVGRLAKAGSSSLRDQCLWCISELLNAGQGDNAERVVPLCETWYYELDSQPLEFLLKLSKSPILEPRLAVQKAYTNLADQAWALKVMRDHPTFCEYLLDRTTESEDEGYVYKYTTIARILRAKACAEIFPPSFILKLRTYEKQGAMYVQAASQVATEEG